jgi:hypothetical protein
MKSDAPPLDRINRVLHRAVARNDNADDARIALEGGFNDARSVNPRHPQIGDHDVEGELFEKLNRLFPLSASTTSNPRSPRRSAINERRAGSSSTKRR